MKAFHTTVNSVTKLIDSLPPDALKAFHLMAGKLALPIVRTTRSRMLDWAEELKSIEALLETFHSDTTATEKHQSHSAMKTRRPHRRNDRSPKR